MANSLRLLGLAKKAGRLALGAEASSEAAEGGRAAMILSASDASERALRQARSMAERYGAVYVPLPYAAADLGEALGRGSPGTLAVTDPGLAAAFAKALAKEDGRFRQIAEAAAQAASSEKEHNRRPKGGRGTGRGGHSL